jgi:hypothetical protein
VAQSTPKLGAGSQSQPALRGLRSGLLLHASRFALDNKDHFATTPWPSPQSTTRARPLEMKKQARPIERPCRTCRGTGLAPAKQPKRPGVRVYPPRCAECLGKGKISD